MHMTDPRMHTRMALPWVSVFIRFPWYAHQNAPTCISESSDMLMPEDSDVRVREFCSVCEGILMCMLGEADVHASRF